MEDERCPLQYYDFKSLDHKKMCPSYSTASERPTEQGISVEDLPMLQSDLETLLAAVNRRSRLLETENKVLAEWCDKKEKKGVRQKELEILNSLKRCKPSFVDERASKKQKLDEKVGIVQAQANQKLKGNKKSSSSKNQDVFEIDDEVSTLKSKSSDTPNRFWATVEPYCADITMEDLKFLEDSIKASEEEHDCYKVPALGKHYSEKWALEDLREEQEFGKKALDKKRSTLKVSNTDNVGDTALNAMMKKATENLNLPAEEVCPFGPLTQRLISAFVEENIIAPITEESLEQTAAKGLVDTPGKGVPGGSKFMHVPHARTLEVRMRQELAAQDIIERPEKNADDDKGDEVLCELKKRQGELQALVSLNQSMMRELLEAAQTEMRKQELRHRVQSADAEVLEWFRKFSIYKQNKKSPSKREREQASKALKERETILRVLNSEEL